MIERAGFLTLDLGTDTGWCREVFGSPPRFGTLNLRSTSKHPGAVFCNLVDWLNDHCEDEPPEKIIYEQPFMMIPKSDDEGRRGGNAATLDRLISLTVPVKIIAFRYEIPVFPVAVQSARAAFLHGKAKKPEIFQECIRRGWKPANEHESDAGCILDYCIQLFHPEEWARANPMLAVQRAQKRRRR